MTGPQSITQHSKTLKLVAEITQNKHFDQHLDTRIVCDASTTGLGVALEQHSPEGWVAVAYASRFSEIIRGKIFCKRTRTIKGRVGNRTFQILSIWKTFYRHN